MYASGAGKGRSSGGTPWGRNRQSYGLGRGQVFLEVVRCGSFRSAAERPELSIKVVRRRIDDFERQVGATLFTRDVHGTRLTDEGSLISCFGSRTHGSRLVRPAAPAIPSPTRFRAKSGSPSPKVWERFGWPLAFDFQQSFPNILVDLHYAMRSADVSRHEADVRSICRGPPRLMSNWSGSAEYI
jgi:DNA-binding transcriptional LysR family regulator